MDLNSIVENLKKKAVDEEGNAVPETQPQPSAKGKEPEEKGISSEQALTMALIGTLPSLLGYAVGGNAGGAAGAKAGGDAVATMSNHMQAESEKAKQAKEYALKEKHMNTEEMFKKGELSNKQRELAMKEKELQLAYGPGSGKAPGKALAAEQSDKLASHDFALTSLQDLKSVVGANSDKMGPFAGRLAAWNPKDSTGQAMQTQINTVLQNIGKSLEGGKMTDQDRVFYQKMLPSGTDTPETAALKIEAVERMIQNRKKADLDAYGRAGYNVAQFEVPVPRDASILHAQEKGKAKGKGMDLGATNAYAAPPMPAFDKMSDEDLKKYVGSMK